VVSSVIITGYNALVTPAATYDLGAVLNTAAYGSCTGAKTITLTTNEHALASSVHTNTRKNQKNAFATTGTAPACAAVGPAGAHVNMVVPYLPFTNLGSGTDLNAVGALAHVKCEAGAFAVVANAAPGLFASKDADNRLNIQPAAATIITGTFADADRPKSGGTPSVISGANADDLISQTVNIFSFDCTSDNRFNVDPLFDQSHNGMDKILLMGGRDPISDYYGYSHTNRDYTFFSAGGSNEAIYSSAFNYGRTQDGTSNNANDGDVAKLSKCSVATVENKDTLVAGGGASGAAGDERYEVARPHAYIARGKDTLWLTPTPDAMTGKKIHMTVTTPASGCSVTEVTKGSHESTVCSGRGNCDYATGTCNCDAGYTLEACSEQTVLV